MNTAGIVIKNTGVITLGRIFTLGAGVLWTAAVARYMSPVIYGTFVYWQSAVVILSIFVNFGLEQLAQKEVAREHANSYSYLWPVIAIKTFLSLIIFGSFFAYGVTTGWNTTEREIILWLSGTALVDALTSAFRAVLYAYEQMGPDIIAQIIRSLLMLLSGIFLIYNKGPWTLIQAGVLAAALVQLAYEFWSVLNLLSDLPRSPIFRQFTEMSRLLRLLSKSIPYMTTALISVLFSNIVIILMGNLHAGDVSLGELAAAQRIYSFIFIVPGAVMQAIFPTFSRLYAESRERFAKAFDSSYCYLFWISVPMAVGLWLTSSIVVQILYGSEYEGASGLLRILSLSLINGVGYVLGPALIAMNRQVFYTIVYGLALILVAALGYFLIPIWGAPAACWALIAGNVLGFGIYSTTVYHGLRLRFPTAWVVKTVVASLAMGIVVYILLLLTKYVVVIMLAASLFYLGFTWALGIFSEQEKKRLIFLILSKR